MPIEVVQDVAKRCQAGQLKPWEQKMKDDRGLSCEQLGEAVAGIVEAKIKKSSQSEIPLFVYNSLTEGDFKEYANLQSIDRVEVMATGNWKGDPYTEQDLDGMVTAFNTLSFKPRLKLGHGSQKIADGMPALGYVSKLWREGKKLVASFVDIPQKLYELIKNKAYDSVSAEVWFNRKFEDKKYPRVLTAIALLGDQIPAVETLKDISAMYSLPGEGGEIRVYTSEDYKPEEDMEYLSLEEIESICPDCAERFKAMGMEQINYADFKKWLKSNRPTKASIQSQLNALASLVKAGKIGKLKVNQLADPAAIWSGVGASFTSCVSALEGKAGITDANSLCAWLHHEVEGVWPAEGSKQSHNKEDKEMTDEQKKEMEELKAKNAEMEKSLEEKAKETESFKAELSKKDEEGRKEKRDTWIEKYSTGDNPKIAPREKPFVSYLMEQLDGNGDDTIKKLSLDDEETKKKEEFTPVEAFKKLFEMRAGLSGLIRELSTGGATQRGEGPLSLDEEIELYMAENDGKSNEDAIAHLQKTKPDLFKKYGRPQSE